MRREARAVSWRSSGVDPAVDTVIGFTGGGGGARHHANTARMFIALKPLAERADQRRRGDRAAAPASWPASPVRRLVSSRPSRICASAAAASNAQYQFTLQRRRASQDLNAWAPRGLQRLRETAPARRRQQRPAGSRPRGPLAIDRGTAARLGITPQLIDDTLYDAFGQRQVSTMYTQLNQYHVVMEVEPALLAEPRRAREHLRALEHGRRTVPLSALTHVRTDRHRRSRSTTRASSRR